MLMRRYTWHSRILSAERQICRCTVDMVRHLSSYTTSILRDSHVIDSDRRPMRGNPNRVYWSPLHSRSPASFTAGELLEAMQNWRFRKSQEISAICIIEGITSDWIDEIGDAMNLDAAFFVRHFNKNWDNRSHPWHWAVEPDQPREAQLGEESRQWRSIDASFSLPRQLKGNLVRTRISYYRIERMC